MGETRSTFRGRIAGIGSASGVRVVLGWWPESPYGGFADAMVEDATGHRVLLAPSTEVADFVAATYSFDEVRVGPVEVEVTDERWRVRAPGLELELEVGSRTALGRVLRLVPARLAASPVWASLVDPAARLLLRGVRTRGTAGNGRREWYGATDMVAVTGLSGRYDGRPLGALRPVRPACRFGFSSTPRTPSVTHVVSTVEVPAVMSR